MSDVLRAVKNEIKQTPLWPLLRPRRIHVYGVGAPKTGTNSVSKLFGAYRAGHEQHVDQTLNIIRKKRDGAPQSKVIEQLRRRDRRWRLEVESAYFFAYVCEALLSAFPGAKFICTVRAPQSWLRSIIDQCINNERDQLSDAWKSLRDLNFGSPPETYPLAEQALARYGLHSIDGFLSYWAWHNRTILNTIPPNRRLFVRTSQLSSAVAQIAHFVEISPSVLETEGSHANKAPRRHDVLNKVPKKYLENKITEHCQPVVERLTRETSISFNYESRTA